MSKTASEFLQNFAMSREHQQQQQQQLDEDDSLAAHQRKRKTSSRIGVTLSAEQKMRLIDYIYERQQIWNSSCEGFRSNQARQNAFNEVALLLSDTNDTFSRIQIQEEWGKLRYCFTRIVKKLMEEANGQQINESQMAAISWPYWKQMNFLLPGVKTQLLQQLSSTEGETQENQSVDIMESPSKESVATILAPKVRKKKGSRRTQINYNDSVVLDDQYPNKEEANEVYNRSTVMPLSSQDLLKALYSSQQLLQQQHHLFDEQQQNQLGQSNEYSCLPQMPANEQTSYCNGMTSGAVISASTAANLVAALGLVSPPGNLELQQRQEEENRRKVSNSLEKMLRRPMPHHDDDQASTQRTAPSSASPTLSPLKTHVSGQNEGQHQQHMEAGRESSEPDYGSLFGCGGDINESFGHCMVQQLQTVAKKNPALGLQMRRELMEVSFKYEMKAFSEE